MRVLCLMRLLTAVLLVQFPPAAALVVDPLDLFKRKLSATSYTLVSAHRQFCGALQSPS
jgi:hypothetical protein